MARGQARLKKVTRGSRASQGRSMVDVGAAEAEQVPSACCYESGQGGISRACLWLGPGWLVPTAQQVMLPPRTLLASTSHYLLHAWAGPP